MVLDCYTEPWNVGWDQPLLFFFSLMADIFLGMETKKNERSQSGNLGDNSFFFSSSSLPLTTHFPKVGLHCCSFRRNKNNQPKYFFCLFSILE